MFWSVIGALAAWDAVKSLRLRGAAGPSGVLIPACRSGESHDWEPWRGGLNRTDVLNSGPVVLAVLLSIGAWLTAGHSVKGCSEFPNRVASIRLAVRS
jgi:hypothetical protein